MPVVHLLDYVAGNIRSLANAIEKVGYTIEWVRTPEDVQKAQVCQFLYMCSIGLLSLVSDSYPPRCRTFRSLPVAIWSRWLHRPRSEAHPGWKTIPRHLCGLAGTV